MDIIFSHDLVNAKWCPWAAWGHCSETCGDGIKTRTRSCGCPAPKGSGCPCRGATLQSSPCLETTCARNQGIIILYYGLVPWAQN